MSTSDEMMWSYMELLTDRTPAAIANLRAQVASGAAHPMDTKIALAQEIIADFHGEQLAVHAADEFNKVFRQRQTPDEIPEMRLACGTLTLVATLLSISKLCPSRAEAERLIKQGAVELDGQRVNDVRMQVDLSKPTSLLLRVGKRRFVRIVAG